MAEHTERSNMAKLVIDSNPTFTTDVEVRESDKFTESVFVSLKRNFGTTEIAAGELFLTPSQLDQIGRFFVRQAEEIRQSQLHR